MTLYPKAVITGLLLLAVLSPDLEASGPVGVFAVLEKVVFEPNEQSPERIQMWGAFAFVDGGINATGKTTAPLRGYLYFTMPDDVSEAQAKVIRTEWADLKRVASSGEAIAFGDWGYIGGFGEGLNLVYVTIQVGPRSYRGVELSVTEGTDRKPRPTPYVTNTGIVKLAADGSHAAIVKRLKEALK